MYFLNNSGDKIMQKIKIIECYGEGDLITSSHRSSDINEAMKIAAARQPVLTDSAKELPAAPRPKCSANSGNTGCTQYSSEKVAKPARKRARLMRL